jgi:hypothetical protein
MECNKCRQRNLFLQDAIRIVYSDEENDSDEIVIIVLCCPYSFFEGNNSESCDEMIYYRILFIGMGISQEKASSPFIGLDAFFVNFNV